MTPYTDSYIESVFEAWYAQGCPQYAKLYETLHADERGRVPVPPEIANWASKYRWSERRDELNGRAVILAEENLVAQQVEMWKRQADRAAEIGMLAYEKIKRDGFDSSASAVQALKWAQEEERKTRGAEGFIAVIKDKSNEDLVKMVRELATRQVSIEDGGIIEADTNNEESA